MRWWSSRKAICDSQSFGYLRERSGTALQVHEHIVPEYRDQILYSFAEYICCQTSSTNRHHAKNLEYKRVLAVVSSICDEFIVRPIYVYSYCKGCMALAYMQVVVSSNFCTRLQRLSKCSVLKLQVWEVPFYRLDKSPSRTPGFRSLLATSVLMTQAAGIIANYPHFFDTRNEDSCSCLRLWNTKSINEYWEGYWLSTIRSRLQLGELFNLCKTLQLSEGNVKDGW